MVLVLQFFRELHFIEARTDKTRRTRSSVAVPSGTALH